MAAPNYRWTTSRPLTHPPVSAVRPRSLGLLAASRIPSGRDATASVTARPNSLSAGIPYHSSSSPTYGRTGRTLPRARSSFVTRHQAQRRDPHVRAAALRVGDRGAHPLLAQ